MKVLLKMMALKARTHVISSTILKGSLNKALDSIKKLQEEVFNLKEDLVEACDLYFEHAKKQVAFLYPSLDLSQMDYLRQSWEDNQSKKITTLQMDPQLGETFNIGDPLEE